MRERDAERAAVVAVMRRIMAVAGLDPGRLVIVDQSVAGWPLRSFPTALGPARGMAERRGDQFVVTLATGLAGDELLGVAVHELTHCLRHLDGAGRLPALDRRLHELEAELAEWENLPAFRKAVELERKQRERWAW